jgi:AcrR family transcriptional regulator
MTKAGPAKAQPPRRRQRDAERTRAAILAAAQEVFIRGDYHAAALSDIARRAGVTQSLIHHHFQSKKGLYVAAVHAYLADLDEGLKGIVEPSLDGADDASSFLDSALRGYSRFLDSHEQCVRLYRILDLSMHNDPDLVAGLDELDEQGREPSTLHLMRAAHQRLLAMRQKGLLRPGVEPLPLLSAMLCAVEHWYTSSRRLNHRLAQAVGSEEAVSLDDFLRTLVIVFTEGALVKPAKG